MAEKLKILCVADGKNQLIESINSSLDYSSKYKIDIISFRNTKSGFYNKIINLPPIRDNKFHKIFSVIFLCSFLIQILFRYRKYDIIHFHMFYIGIYFLGPFLKKKNTILTFWGSDFYKASPSKKKKIKKAIKSIQKITCTNPQLASEISSCFQLDKNEVQVIPYVSSALDKIKTSPEKIEMVPYKIVIGTNSNVNQNHLEIIEAISKCKLSPKDVEFIVPLTYGRASESYKNLIHKKLEESIFKFTTLNDFLTEEKIVQFRVNSDVLIQVQKTDQLSAAMIEHLMANNIVITGSWLPYDILDENGVEMLKVNKIEDITELLDAFKTSFIKPNNKPIIAKLFSSESITRKWMKLYEDLI